MQVFSIKIRDDPYLSENEKEKQLTLRFYQYVKTLEFEKLFYFALTYTQQTIVITSPADGTKQKEFLGYDWSSRKGKEGIQIIVPGGKMYCETNRKAERTLASLVRQSFSGEKIVISEDNKCYVDVVTTADMLNFTRESFDKKIKITKIKKVESKYPIVTIKSILKGIDGPTTKVDNSKILESGKIPVVAQNSDSLICGYTNTEDSISDLPLILFGDHTECRSRID